MATPTANDHENPHHPGARARAASDPAGPVNPMSRTRVGVLRGIRTGALLATIALAVLAVRFTPDGTEDRITPLVAAALYLPATSLVWLFTVLLTRELHHEPFPQRATGAILLAIQWVGLALVYYSITIYLIAPEVFLGHPVAVGAACLSIGVLTAADTLLRTHPARRPGGPHDMARWRPLPSADTSRAAATLTGLTALVLALSVALAPTWATRPAQRTAPEPSQIPAVPTTVAGESAWTLDLDDGAAAIAAGAAGPVVATGTEIRGLDPADGSTRWTYHRPNTQLLDLPAPSPGLATRIITGPDRRYAAFAAQASGPMGMRSWYAKKQVVVTVLDTLTGRVAAERTLAGQLAAEATTVPATQPIQLTDTAAFIGTEAIDLTTGKTLWTLPEPESVGTTGTPAHVGPAGHSTFVLRSEPGSDMAADLVLVSQDDPDRRTGLGRAATSANRPLVIDGWTIQYTEEPSHAEGGPAAAINIDEVAAAGGTADVRGIDLGQTTGPDLRLSRTSLIATALPTDGGPVPQPATVFDPATRTTSPVEQSTTVDTTTFAADLDRDADTVLLHLASADGSVTNDVRITAADTGHPRYTDLVIWNEYNEPGDRFWGASLVTVPGALLVRVQSNSKCCVQVHAFRQT